MQIRGILTIVATALLVCLCSEGPTFAETETFCPETGTVAKGRETYVVKGWKTPYEVKGWETHNDYTTTYHGVDPTDAKTCLATLNSAPYWFSAPRVWEERFLLSFYRTGRSIWIADSEDRIRAGLAPVLSGQRDSASFDTNVVTASASIASPSTPRTERWYRTGEAILTIDGKKLNTIRFQHVIQNFPGSLFSSTNTWDLWYDPVHHIFVKGARNGSHTSYSFEVLSIASP